MPLTRRHALRSLAAAGAAIAIGSNFPRLALAAKKDPKWEEAIEKGLKWVAKTQSSLGHWTATGLSHRDDRAGRHGPDLLRVRPPRRARTPRTSARRSITC